MSNRIQIALRDLRADLACVEVAIHSLEILSGQKSRRGRPLNIADRLKNGSTLEPSRKVRKKPRSKR